MSNSVWPSMTKRDIDQATEEFVKLANKGLFTYDCYDGNEEREKNKRFLKDYIVPLDWRDLIIKSLQPTQCGDVQVDQRPENNRNGNLMYVYFYDAELNRRGDGPRAPKHHVRIYIKVEKVKQLSGGKLCLVISFHEAEYLGKPRYEELSD